MATLAVLAGAAIAGGQTSDIVLPPPPGEYPNLFETEETQDPSPEPAMRTDTVRAPRSVRQPPAGWATLELDVPDHAVVWVNGRRTHTRNWSRQRYLRLRWADEYRLQKVTVRVVLRDPGAATDCGLPEATKVLRLQSGDAEYLKFTWSEMVQCLAVKPTVRSVRATLEEITGHPRASSGDGQLQGETIRPAPGPSDSGGDVGDPFQNENGAAR